MCNSLLVSASPLQHCCYSMRPRDCHCCRAMHITQLNRECLLHLFSFLDKNSRKNLAETCHKLLEVFQDPLLWSLLNFHSPVELKKDNFLLGPALKYLSICWYSERVKVCNIEDWMKNSFQKDFCNRHENTVSDFLLDVCNRYVLWVWVCSNCLEWSESYFKYYIAPAWNGAWSIWVLCLNNFSVTLSSFYSGSSVYTSYRFSLSLFFPSFFLRIGNYYGKVHSCLPHCCSAELHHSGSVWGVPGAKSWFQTVNAPHNNQVH